MSDTIYTVVSHPGPAERRVLSTMASLVQDTRRVGANVALRSIETKPVEPTLPALALLHGRGHCAAVWQPFIRSFAASRRIVALDLPGFGHSGCIDAASVEPEAALQFFSGPVEDALSREGALVLIGHSLGGLVALEIALRGKVDVRGLVLVAAMGLGPFVLPGARAYLRAGPERLARVARFFGGRSRRRSAGAMSAELAALRAELHLVRGGRRSAKKAFDVLVPLFGDAFHRRERLTQVRCPTMLLWGDSDDAFPLPVAMDAQARIPHAELEVIAAGHSPHLEAPDLCIAIVRTFLDRCVDSAFREPR